MTLKIFNSLSGQKEVFKPKEDNKVKMYVCGMTVYDFCHLGHARVLVAFDIITRYLRAKGYEVTYVRNITDVDDKIIVRAAQNDEPVEELTERFIRAMHEDEQALAVLRPDIEPRATAYIDQIISMTQTLCDKGFAYPAANGDVYYAVDKFEGYGKLSRRRLDEQQEGARVEVDANKHNPFDFVLWKAAKPGEVSWPSPWGAGRPGWHIECSAMSTQCLGDSFDIHGGGPDLKFPHHENEIAQSEAATGCQYVNYWMHAGAVRVNKEKMSKSLGNFFTIREILEKYPAEVVRYFIASSHYRSAIDYSDEVLAEAEKALERFYQSLRGVDLIDGSALLSPELAAYVERFNGAMDDDFNTAGAVSVLFELARALNQAKRVNDPIAPLLARGLIELAEVLGILQDNPDVFLKSGAGAEYGPTEEEIEQYIELRNQARTNKDWAESDRIRDLLKEQGVILNDSREGTTWQRG